MKKPRPSRLSLVIILGFGLITFLAVYPMDFLWTDWLANVRWHWSLFLGLSLLFSILFRRRVLTPGLALCLVVSAWPWIRPGVWPMNQPDAPDHAEAYSMIYLTVEGNFRTAMQVEVLAADHAPDLFILTEIGRQWDRDLAVFYTMFAHVYVDADRPDGQGVVIASQWPILRTRKLPVAPEDAPLWVATVMAPFGELRVAALSTHSPKSETSRLIRNRALAGTAQHLYRLETPLLIGGRFGGANHLRPMQPLFAGGRLRHAAPWGAWAPTWPAKGGAWGITLDHIFLSPDLIPLSYRALHAAGSDHRSLQITFTRKEKSG